VLRILLVPQPEKALDPTADQGDQTVGRVARTLRDRGQEVVLLAPGAALEEYVAIALQEDVDLLVLAGEGAPDAVAETRAALAGSGAGDVGVHAVGPGEPLTALLDDVRRQLDDAGA
jgi:methylmalonyl-CoA mutase cobalamin-binding subunit